MSRWLYTSDLHGWTWAYEQAREIARAVSARGVIVGGDLLPWGPRPLATQRGFIAGFLADYLRRLQAAGLHWHGIFGNDDLGLLLPEYRAVLSAVPGCHDPSARWCELADGLRLWGLSHVPDHPFGLKDWSVLDDREWTPPQAFGRAVQSTEAGLVPIADYPAWLAARDTMGELLDSCLLGAPPMDRAVLVVHGPPAGLGLAKISQSEDVGSGALRRWLARHQPLLTLHGHIHESPRISGLPMAHFGRTQCVQCGQEPRHRWHYAVLDYTDGKLTVQIGSRDA